MPIDITFTLSDNDLEHFQGIVDRAKAATEDAQSDESIVVATRLLIEDAKSNDLPDFINERLAKLEVAINMVGDKEWQLSTEERKRVLGALVYFCDPEDLIPDDMPGLGFIDDAIYVEIVLRELRSEIESYEEFCEFRSAEVSRRLEDGQDPYIKREEWLAEKRKTLQARMRRPGRSGGWRLRW